MATPTGPNPGMHIGLQQRQTLVMTPQLQQSIKLLQMSTIDLIQYVEQQLQENPLLMADDGELIASAGKESDGEQDDFDPAIVEENRIAGQADFLNGEASENSDVVSFSERHTMDERGGLDSPDATHWEEHSSPGNREEAGYWNISNSQKTSYGVGENPLEQTVANEVSLREHLAEQFQVDNGDEIQRMIGLYMIDLVDESGYLQEPLEEIAEALGCSVLQVEQTLQQLQQLDPVGVFARSLTECLQLQLIEREQFSHSMEILLAHLDMLGRGEVEKLAQKCDITKQEMQELTAQIRACDPKPGLAFANDAAEAVRPDVAVIPDGKGGWKVELIPDQLPKLLVDRRYYAEISAQTKDASAKKYLTDQYSNASWLVKAMDQRAQTILKVSAEVVAQQENFLKDGVRYLKPLTLRQVAEVVGVHESTVSRVTSNKYMLTPRGLFELKYFFSSGVHCADGAGDMAAEAVKAQIRQLIDHEDPRKTLSDDRITEMLQSRGVEIARRTVAKYREAMGLGSSVERRRMKKLKAAS